MMDALRNSRFATVKIWVISVLDASSAKIRATVLIQMMDAPQVMVFVLRLVQMEMETLETNVRFVSTTYSTLSEVITLMMTWTLAVRLNIQFVSGITGKAESFVRNASMTSRIQASKTLDVRWVKFVMQNWVNLESVYLLLQSPRRNQLQSLRRNQLQNLVSLRLNQRQSLRLNPPQSLHLNQLRNLRLNPRQSLHLNLPLNQLLNPA
jgi:hypothetical protein